MNKLSIPTCGRIAIGLSQTDEQGVTHPVALNFFAITAQFKHDGNWVEHPVADEVRKVQGAFKEGDRKTVLKSIPIRFMFNNPQLNVRTKFEAWSNISKAGRPDHRPICTGNGNQCRRATMDGSFQVTNCPGNYMCGFAASNGAKCSELTRLNVQIDVPNSESYQADPFNTFIFRSAGVNTRDNLAFKLACFYTRFGERLRGIPFELVLRGKSGPDGHLFYYADIVQRGTDEECMRAADEQAELDKRFNWASFEAQVAASVLDSKGAAVEDGPLEYPEIEEFICGGESKGTNSTQSEEVAVSVESAGHPDHPASPYYGLPPVVEVEEGDAPSVPNVIPKFSDPVTAIREVVGISGLNGRPTKGSVLERKQQTPNLRCVGVASQGLNMAALATLTSIG